MGAFTLQDPHHEKGGLSAVESDDEVEDFDIDSDISDADLLEPKQELNKLGLEKAQWELADATIAL
jgi:hypothetical protein